MNNYCILSDSTVIVDANNLASWHQLSKMKVDVARRNFKNPLPKLNLYDSIVVVLDTGKPYASYKYPINKPSYKSNTCNTDLAKISLTLFVKQACNKVLVQDDPIELNDRMPIEQLNDKYKKVITEADQLFNCPSRTIKFLAKYDKKKEVTTDSKDNFLQTKNNSSLSISQCVLEGGKLEESATVFTINSEVLNPIVAQYNIDDSSEHKRLKLSSDPNENDINNPSKLLSNQADFCTDPNLLVLSNFNEKLSNREEGNFENTYYSDFNKENVDAQDFKFGFDVCINNELSLNKDLSILPANNSAKTQSLNETARSFCEFENVSPQDFKFNFKGDTVNNSTSTQSKYIPVTSTNEIKNKNEKNVVVQDIKCINHDLYLDANPKISAVTESLMANNFVSVQSQNETKTEVEIVEDKNKNTDDPSDFVIFHSLGDSFNASNVDSDYFISDEYFKGKETSDHRKGIKRKQESCDTKNTKAPRYDKNQGSSPKNIVASKNYLKNWDLYNFNKPQDCFFAVQNQWGGTLLPNPHDDLTCRFHAILPTYSSEFIVPGNDDNNIEHISIYVGQITEIEEEMQKIRFNLDNFGSTMERRVINENLDRWKKLKDMMGRLYDACNDSNRFYKYYKDERTGWNASYISEYHNNEIKRQFDVLDAYTDFYGFS